VHFVIAVPAAPEIVGAPSRAQKIPSLDALDVTIAKAGANSASW
jgi:hypothetical protein